MSVVSTKRKNWQLTEKTKGGLGGNWTHISYYLTRDEAEKKASQARKDYSVIKKKLGKRGIKFTAKVNVSRRKK